MNPNILPPQEAPVAEAALPQEISFLSNKADALFIAAAAGQKFGDITLHYKPGSGLAKWRFGIDMACVSHDQQTAVTVFSFGRELAEETGNRQEMTNIAFRNDGAWQSNTVIRDKGREFQQSELTPLDRKTYTLALQSMVALESRQFARDSAPHRSVRQRVVAFLLNSNTQ